MHLVQTPSSTSTATMAYQAPPSPTLTNPDMILPFGEEYDKDYGMPSPDDGWGNQGTIDAPFSIGSAHSPLTTPILYGNGTMLSDIGEVTEAESTPGRKLPGPAERRMLKQAQIGSLRSSPTGTGRSALVKRTKPVFHERKISMESNSTVTSERPLPSELFKDFDDGVSVDDSVFQGDDEESVADSHSEEVIASETLRLSKKEDVTGDDAEDPNSSAALSRRAEQILLNAKLRLNNMEGNLTRARTSLFTSSTSSLSSIHSSSPLSRATPSPPEGRRITTKLSGTSLRQHRLPTPVDSPMASPGHSRVYSENNITSAPMALFPARSASAAARYGRNGSELSPTGNNNTGASRELRNPYLSPLSEDEVPDVKIQVTSSRSSMSLDSEYESAGGEHRLTRPPSVAQMRDLRDQMHDLKGRLSVLRDRARDDTMKRRSMQSLRTPSPFTAAEQWYTQDKSYASPGLSADAGMSLPSPPHEKRDAFDDDCSGVTEDEIILNSRYAASETGTVYEDLSERHQSPEANHHEPQTSDSEGNYETAVEESQDLELEDDTDYNDEMVNREEPQDYESDSSMYHDSLEVPISHEDREDAFDYEHFFLHSAMGTMSQQRAERRGSFSSEDSVETTRGPSAPEDRPTLGHHRSESTDSISTIDTFQTATEGTGSDEDDEESRDTFGAQDVNSPVLRSPNLEDPKRSTFGTSAPNDLSSKSMFAVPEESNRPISAIHTPLQRNDAAGHRPSISSVSSTESSGTQRSFPLIHEPQSDESTNGRLTPRVSHQSSSSTLVDDMSNGERQEPSPVHMLGRDDQVLVERLVASLGKCVLGLQEAGRGSYEGRVWRRRLDFARRTLEGEEEVI